MHRCANSHMRHRHTTLHSEDIHDSVQTSRPSPRLLMDAYGLGLAHCIRTVCAYSSVSLGFLFCVFIFENLTISMWC